MKKFFVYENKDSADAYVRALESDGFVRTQNAFESDFILYDTENVTWRREKKQKVMRDRPGFIYPHTPLTCYLWDGIYEPLPVACNFVAGKGPKACMRAYGYPHRIETVGFSRCEILPFQPYKPRTDRGPNLLFVPARPRRDHGKQAKLDQWVLDWIIKNRETFEHVQVCRIEGQFPQYGDETYVPRQHMKFTPIQFITTNPKATSSPAMDMVERIDRADIVISVTTPSALAVARGKPTIMYGQDGAPGTLSGRFAKHFDDYRDIYAYPLSLESMTIKNVLHFAECGDSQVERWKHAFVGVPFDPQKFLSVVKEYV